MIEIHPSQFYLLLEGIVGLTALLGAIVFVQWRKHSNKKRTLVKFVDTLTSNTENRKAQIQSLLTTNENNDDEAIELAVNKILQQETVFYQYAVGLMLSKDAQPLLELDKQIESLTSGVIASYQDITVATQEPAVDAETNALSAEITDEMSQIKNDIHKLQKQNDVLLHTLQNLTIAAPAALTRHDTITDIGDEADEDPIINIDDQLEDEIVNEPSQVIDISGDIESLGDFDEEPTPRATAVDATDIDALLDEVRNENIAGDIEEIPDDLLHQHDDVASTDNDAVTDIDALLEQVAKENTKEHA